jgi:hypothetical protein
MGARGTCCRDFERLTLLQVEKFWATLTPYIAPWQAIQNLAFVRAIEAACVVLLPTPRLCVWPSKCEVCCRS